MYQKRVSGRRDSNSRHLAWEANALPLNYSRIESIIFARRGFVKAPAGFSFGAERTGTGHRIYRHRNWCIMKVRQRDTGWLPETEEVV